MKSKLFLGFLLLVSVCSVSALADWELQTSGTTAALSAVYFVDDAGTLGFAVGANGTLLKTTNGGAGWAAKPASSTENLNDVLFPATTNGYICGANGTARKSTNIGETFAASVPVATADASAEFKKASYNGNTIYMAASKGSSTSGFVLTSTDSGSTWPTSVTLTNLNPDGVFLGTESSSVVVWVWGNNFSASQYEIWKDYTMVWSGSTRVTDLIMLDENNGFAVGESGLVLETTAGGDLGDWGTISTSATGITGNLNSLFFLTSSFGWIVGDSGASAVTADGGLSWSPYTIPSSPNINDIYVTEQTSGLVHAYLACDGGKIYKLASPTITNVTPEAKSQGWPGTVEVTGTGFVNGAYLSFYKTGLTTEDIDISIIATDYISSTEVQAYIYVSGEAVVGWRDVSITNPDATTSKETNAFNVTSSEAEVQRWTIDDNSVASFKGTNTTMTLTSSPRLVLRAYSPNGVSIASLNAQLLVRYSNGVYFTVAIPQTALTVIDANTIAIDHTITQTLTAGATGVLVFLAFEDNSGDIGANEITVDIASPLPQPTATAMPGSRTGKDAGYQYGGRNFLRDGARINWRLRPGTIVYNYRIDVFDPFGRLIYNQIVNDPSGVVSSKKITIPPANFPQHGLMSAAAYTIRIINLDNNEVLVSNQIFCVPWE